MTSALTRETYLPGEDGPLARVDTFLKVAEQAGTGRYFISSSSSDDTVELPAEVCHALRKVVDALRQGLGVTVAATAATVTAQQAAALLGVSNSAMIRLFDDGEIPYERVDTHRQVLLRDVLAYRERRRAAAG